MSFHNRILDVLQPVLEWAFMNPQYSAPVAVLLASYILYGVLGKKYLGADDDYWETIRARLIPLISTIAKRSGGYVYTVANDDEYAGFVKMEPDEFERRLEDAEYLRQVVASLHQNEGQVEDGSWAKMYGPLYPVERIGAFLSRGKYLRVPVLGPSLRRFTKALNTILAAKQRHVFFYVEETDNGTRIHVYGHDEWNPINPFTAFLHYTGGGAFTPSPARVRRDLEDVDVELIESSPPDLSED